ncbi:molybdate transport system permease protein [Rhodopseudomonas thermotolerans]|uniref:Molybdenum transport system permease n=2 Tax=Rhodopseudomonas TaxID=1073 RepID=A0A336JUJ3_9BRAD|nr:MULTISPECIES: molybdate ABC transporter permease subunit [Rhodopseudomonas]RED25814.1 molybdate transport system permease protein [Rhodopseudomonas pentothenatexigens]REF90443.1 molybdate transport system permease protein [Rhodopseudomonas thermotolerans]SSW93142.1 molybdate transport system permease protein [Rhodopseudomonas pentothenatexigens]
MLAAAIEALRDPALIAPALLSLEIAAATLVLHIVLGTLLGWALAQRSWPGRTVLDALVTIPLVFPPIALGFFLLLLLGRRSPVGQWLDAGFGFSFVFSVEGVLLASVIAGLPLVVKPIEAAIASVSRSLGEASRTLGRNELETFLFVILPNIRGAIVAGLVLGTARSLGEVGITLMLGGNIVGKTNTISLEVYNAVFNGEYGRAVVLSGLLGMVSLGVFALLRRASRPIPN